MTRLNPQFLDSLRQRANDRNVSFRISLRWPIYVVNSVDKTKLSRPKPNREPVHRLVRTWRYSWERLDIYVVLVMRRIPCGTYFDVHVSRRPMTDEHLNMQRNKCLKNVFTRNERSVRTIVQDGKIFKSKICKSLECQLVQSSVDVEFQKAT